MWHVVSMKPNASRYQFTLNQRHERMALKKPAVERCDWAKLKPLEGFAEDQANALGVVGQMELYISILPNARGATTIPNTCAKRPTVSGRFTDALTSG